MPDFEDLDKSEMQEAYRRFLAMLTVKHNQEPDFTYVAFVSYKTGIQVTGSTPKGKKFQEIGGRVEKEFTQLLTTVSISCLERLRSKYVEGFTAITPNLLAYVVVFSKDGGANVVAEQECTELGKKIPGFETGIINIAKNAVGRIAGYSPEEAKALAKSMNGTIEVKSASTNEAALLRKMSNLLDAIRRGKATYSMLLFMRSGSDGAALVYSELKDKHPAPNFENPSLDEMISEYKMLITDGWEPVALQFVTVSGHIDDQFIGIKLRLLSGMKERPSAIDFIGIYGEALFHGILNPIFLPDENKGDES